MVKLFDLVKVNISTTGTGTITFGPAFSDAFFTPSEAGAGDGDSVSYVIVEGDDVEIGTGVIGSSVTTMTRTVLKSKIGGAAGTTKMTLGGTAWLAFTALDRDILVPANNLSDVANADDALTNLGISDGWAVQPIGVPIPLFDNLTGVAAPPTDKTYRYVLLTADNTGSGQYNEGILTSQSVSGSAPLVIATAVIDLADSPLDGQTVSLINTERRFLRAGSAGTAQNDAMQSHSHPSANGSNLTGPYQGISGGPGSSVGVVGSTTGSNVQAMGQGNGRMDTETRPKNVGVTYYMRIR